MKLLSTDTTNINTDVVPNGIFARISNLLDISNHSSGYLIYLLVLLGVLIIIAVLIYNWWEERRFNKEVESNFSPIDNDPLLDQNKKEFLDKFAATTGYLNDEPENATLVPAVEELEPAQSIDDVYAELLETMSNNNATVSTVENASDVTEYQEPIGGNTIMPEDAHPSESNDILYIPEESVENENLGVASSQTQNSIKDIIHKAFTAENIQKSRIEQIQASAANEKSADFSKQTPFKSILEEAKKTEEKPVVGDVALDVNEANKSENVTDATAQFNKRKSDPASKQIVKFTPAFDSIIPPSISANLDLIGTLIIPQGNTPSFLMESFSKLYKDFDKPVFAYSQIAQGSTFLLNDADLDFLTEMHSTAKELHITASIQLADRSGPISKNTLTRFRSTFESIAKNLNLSVNWHDNEDPLYKASALDAFCIDVDKTMFFHLTESGKGPFTGTKLKGLVEGQGMELGADGQYKYFDVESNAEQKYRMPQFVMFNRDNHPFNQEMLRSSVIKAVTFQLDIPHINTNGTALDRMVIVAKSLEDNLNVKLVDDQNRPLGTLHIDKIREQVKSIHATMQLRGITPGSEFAHRLFS